MKNGQTIKFDGESDEKPGVLPGDIIFVIQEQPHSIFKRSGNNLFIDKKINLSESLTGFSFKLQTLDNRNVLIKSKKNRIIKPEDILIANGEGMPIYKNNEKGNLIINFEVEFPKKIPEKLAEKLEKILPKKNEIKIEEGEDIEEVRLSKASDVSKDSETGRKEAYMSDDEDDSRGGGEDNIGCKTQ